MTSSLKSVSVWISFAAIFLIAPLYKQANIGGYGLELPFNNTVWIGYLLFSTLVLLLSLRHSQWVIPTQWRMYLLLIGCLSLPLAWSDADSAPAVTRTLCLLAGAVFLFCLWQGFRSPPETRWIMWIILVSALLEAVIGCLQVFKVNWVPSGLMIGNGIRPNGMFQQPNIFSSYVATGMMIALWLLWYVTPAQRRLTRAVQLSLLYSMLALGSFTLYLTQSRTGIAALALGLLLFLITPKKPRSLWVLVGIGAIIAGEMLAAAHTQFNSGEAFVRSGHSISSNANRIGMWQASWALFLQQPFTGTGIGEFPTAYADMRASLFQETGILGIKNPDHPHNEILFWAAEGGLIPVIGIILFSLLFAIRLWRADARRFFSYCALLLPLFLHSMTEYPFYFSALHWLAFLALLFTIETFTSETKSVQVRAPFFVGSIAVACLFIGTLFFVTNLQTLSKITQAKHNLAQKFHLSPLQPLMEIRNSVAFHNQILHISQMARLRWALANENEAELRQFIDWGWQFSEEVVREETFEYMLAAALMLEDPQVIHKIRQRAHWLFPENPHFD